MLVWNERKSKYVSVNSGSGVDMVAETMKINLLQEIVYIRCGSQSKNSFASSGLDAVEVIYRN